MKIVLAAAALLSVGLCHAQVFKCEGQGGRTVYSDAPCPGGKAVGNLQGNSVAAERPAPAAPAPEPSQAQIIGGDQPDPQPAEAPAKRTRAERRQAPAGPATVTNCDAAGCWGTDGTRYNRAAGGNFYRQDGAFCQVVGTQLRCR